MEYIRKSDLINLNLFLWSRKQNSNSKKELLYNGMFKLKCVRQKRGIRKFKSPSKYIIRRDQTIFPYCIPRWLATQVCLWSSDELLFLMWQKADYKFSLIIYFSSTKLSVCLFTILSVQADTFEVSKFYINNYILAMRKITITFVFCTSV